ncbi:DinB family protein [Mycolicibacterium phocaicum]|uniref:DinB family protein n=1 Tax=Mycolicibacterium phocaicum TaxID=319706 RepID=UPI002E381468|nr:DinB family protein [Mycolicibacterium phocaicum]
MPQWNYSAPEIASTTEYFDIYANRIETTMTTWSIPQITTGPERRLLESALDRNRAELVNTVRGLPDVDARRRLVASMTTPIGLLKHAAVAERIWFQHILGGVPENDCGGGTTAGDTSFIVDGDETVADVIAEFESASARSRAIAARFDLDETRTHPHLGEVNLRFIYLLAIEDFARHAGHGDILREQIERSR